jgi:hypothetical protein
VLYITIVGEYYKASICDSVPMPSETFTNSKGIQSVTEIFRIKCYEKLLSYLKILQKN